MRQRNAKDRKPTCCKCGNLIEVERQGKYGYCRKCHAENMKRNRPTQKEMSPEEKKKANARSYAHVYVKRGIVIKKPCEVCGSENSQIHHPDYNEPLEIKWLCRKHHLEEHEKEKINDGMHCNT